MSPTLFAATRRSLREIDATAFVPALRAARAAAARCLGSADADLDDVATQAAIEALLVIGRRGRRATVSLAWRVGRLRACDELRRRRGRSPEWRIRHVGPLRHAERWLAAAPVSASASANEDERLVRVLAALPLLPPAQANVITLLLSGEAATPLTPARRQAKRAAVLRLRHLLGLCPTSRRAAALPLAGAP